MVFNMIIDYGIVAFSLSSAPKIALMVQKYHEIWCRCMRSIWHFNQSKLRNVVLSAREPLV